MLPLRAGAKTPQTRHGCKDASTDPDQIQSWWDRWPNSNVGIATGAIGKDRYLIVLDVDPRNGGGASFAELERTNGKLRTMAVQTGGGGTHWYFVSNTPVSGRTGVRPGIDLKGEGGYVVAPPSRLAAGGAYVVSNGADPADLPVWLRELATAGRFGATTALTAQQRAACAAPGDDETHYLSVSDTGIGIPDLLRERVFEDWRWCGGQQKRMAARLQSLSRLSGSPHHVVSEDITLFLELVRGRHRGSMLVAARHELEEQHGFRTADRH